MVKPITRSPARCSNPATTELSTPPDMATAIVSGIRRCQPSQMRDRIGDGIDQGVDLPGGIRAAKREAQARLGLLAREADRGEDVRRLLRAAGACRSTRYGESAKIERDQQRLAIDAVKTNIGGVGRARRAGSVDVRAGDASKDSLFEAVAQSL